jgi:hypothetical protein
MPGSANDTHPQGRSQNGCNAQLSIVEHVKQKTWLLKKAMALSRSVSFDGAEIPTVDPRHKTFYWAH